MAPPEDETLPSGSLLGGSNETTLGFNTTRTTYHMKDIEPPKLKSTRYDDYHRWKIGIEWWADLNRLETSTSTVRDNECDHRPRGL